jgi:hypothetical protein
VRVRWGRPPRNADTTLDGTSLLRFDAEGFVAEQWDGWNRARGRRFPPTDWSPFAPPVS